MRPAARLSLLLRITGSQAIVRRYFVVNGFDGALALLGLLFGFYISGGETLVTVINACIGTAVALTVSGLSSAYISESAEQRKALNELRGAMVSDLEDSAHAHAARVVPWLVAAANGLAPLLIALAILTPLWLAQAGIALPLPPLELAIATAFGILFLLGVFLGHVGGRFWLASGLVTLVIALVTAGIILGIGALSGPV